MTMRELSEIGGDYIDGEDKFLSNSFWTMEQKLLGNMSLLLEKILIDNTDEIYARILSIRPYF